MQFPNKTSAVHLNAGAGEGIATTVMRIYDPCGVLTIKIIRPNPCSRQAHASEFVPRYPANPRVEVPVSSLA